MEQTVQISATASKIIEQLRSEDRRVLQTVLRNPKNLTSTAHRLQGREDTWVVRAGSLRLLFTKNNDTWVLRSIYDRSNFDAAS
jgi:mRNA-degrading endonuclease RelE of RelBE toxin-antitoxin system